MRAVVVDQTGPIDSPTVQDLPEPSPGPGQLLIETHAAGVNFPDAMVIEGTYQVRPPVPFTPGKELAGVVLEVGERVEGFKPGDRVISQIEYGAWAEKVAVPATTCSTIPSPISFAQAVSLGLTYQTAWFALKERSQFRKGETVLVTGAAGGVGLAGVELVNAMGGVAIAGVRHASQHELVKQHGARHVVDLSAPDLGKHLKAETLSITGDRGVDIVLDNVGGEVFDACLRTLGFCGRLVVIGFASGTIPNVKAGLVLVKNISIVGLNWAHYRNLREARVREAQREIFALAVAGTITPAIMASYSLSEYDQALKRLREGTLQGQLVLETDAGRADGA